MTRKVFISFLGTGNYKPCHYSRGEFISDEINFIQEATLEYLGAKQWNSNDAVYIMLTKDAREKNWIDNGQKNKDGNIITQEGLCTRLAKMGLPMRVNDASTFQGSDEKTIMRVFMQMFDLLNEGDELYLDITHAFRYLPMLMVVLANYAKFVKNVSIKSITYGNWEGRDEATNTAQIENLTMYNTLLDWTAATADFLHSGNASELKNLSFNEIKPILVKTSGKDNDANSIRQLINILVLFTDDILTCRGLNIINATNIVTLKEQLDKIGTSIIKPLNPILDKLRLSIQEYKEATNIENGFVAAIWCLEHGMYQQAATIAEETVISVICNRHGIDIDDDQNREVVGYAFYYLAGEKQQLEWNNLNPKPAKIAEIMQDNLITKDFISAFRSLQEIRNDINHAGMRRSKMPMASSSIKYKLKERISALHNLIFGDRD